MREEDVLAREASEVTAAQYPDRLRLGDLHLSLSYQFEPGTARDGVTVRVPAPLLPQLPAERIDWLVPGLLYDKAVALVRNLPKAIRKTSCRYRTSSAPPWSASPSTKVRCRRRWAASFSA